MRWDSITTASANYPLGGNYRPNVFARYINSPAVLGESRVTHYDKTIIIGISG